MASAKKDYFGLSWIVSLVLAIIPITSVICGIVTRFQEGRNLAGILRVVICITGVGAGVLWVCDLVLIILRQKILQLV